MKQNGKRSKTLKKISLLWEKKTPILYTKGFQFIFVYICIFIKSKFCIHFYVTLRFYFIKRVFFYKIKKQNNKMQVKQKKKKSIYDIFFYYLTLMNLQICIMTPDRIFWNQEADEIILPTNTGQMGVLSNHAPLITALDIGVMLIRTKSEWTSAALMGGFALVKQNRVTVLVNEAQSAETINLDEAENNFNIAKNKLEQAEGQKQKVEANFLFKRARARYQLVKNN